MKAPIWGATAAGAALGLWAGPTGVVIGVAVGGTIDVLRYEYRRRWHAWHPLEESHIRAIRLAAPHASDEGIQRQAATAGVIAPREAMVLQTIFEKHAAQRARKEFWAAPKVIAAIMAFQRAYNADFNTSQSLGPLHVTGRFDPRTAAALTLYMHRAVSPDPSTAG